MTVDSMMTRISVLNRALPNRILVVDDDELELELMADRLSAAGFEAITAANGGEALAILERQWFPLIVTDWEMPVMSGIEFTEKLRARGVDDTYVIMLTVRESGMDYERGYFAGVDDYLTKKVPDPELLARVRKGFSTLAMRRSLKEARAALESKGTLDAVTGAHTSTHLFGTLDSEIKRAERYERNLSVMTLGMFIPGGANEKAVEIPEAVLTRVVNTIRNVIRSHVDWVARLDTEAHEPAFAIVLPEAAAVDAVGIKTRLLNALVSMTMVSADEDPLYQRITFSFGFSALDRARTERKPVAASHLVGVAEQCRRCLQTRGHSQLLAVQGSVTHSVAICCRHGYAVESHCHFMGEARLPSPARLAEAG